MNITIGENNFQNNHSNNINSVEQPNYDNTYSKNIMRHVTKSDNVSHKNKILPSDAAVYGKNNNSAMKGEKALDDIKTMASLKDVNLQKNYMTVMSNSLSDEDFAALRKNGFDPAKMEPREMVTVTDEIKAKMAASGKVIAGYNDDLDTETIEAVTGSAAFAEEIKSSFSREDVPYTEDNINNAYKAMEEASGLHPLNDNEILYMIENSIAPTIENIYMTQHSGVGSSTLGESGDLFYMGSDGYVGKTGSNTSLIREDIEKALTESGYTIDSDIYSIAEKMVKREIPLNEENIEKYLKLSGLELPADSLVTAEKIAYALKDGREASDADMTAEEDLFDKASHLVKALDSIDDDTVRQVVDDNKELNIRNLINTNKNGISIENEASISNSVNTVQSGEHIHALRLVNEVRLHMTVTSTYFLLKNNIDVDTVGLGKLVDELKEAENRQFESGFGKQYAVDKDNVKALFEETDSKINEMKTLPAAALGVISTRSSYTLNSVYYEAKSMQEKYIAAGKEYEALMTEVRRDLGDSIGKAFANVPDILREMDMEVNPANEKAVRILGYNSMEITGEAVDKVRDTLETVETIIEKMKPGKVLGLIREGLNPLEISADELLNKLNRMDEATNEPERFSRYLYNLEKNGAVTDEEKESYIGIYRMINHIEKQDSAAVGALINMGGEINFKNLLSAVRTRKHAGMDISIDEDFGATESLINKGVSISEQIERAFIGPEYTAGDNDEGNKDAAEDTRQEEFIKNENEMIRKAASVPKEIIETLEKTGIPATIENIVAADNLLNKKGLYKGVRKVFEKNTVNNGKISRWQNTSAGDKEQVSSSGNRLQDTLDSILEEPLKSFTDRDNAVTAYDDMCNRLMNLINDETTGVRDLSDLGILRFGMNQLFVSSKMSPNEYYEIPIKIGGEQTQMSVCIRHGEESSAAISFESEKYGKVSGAFTEGISGLQGIFATDSYEYLNKLEELKPSLARAFEENNLEVNNVVFLNSSKVNVNIFDANVDNINKDEASQGRDEVLTKSTDAISTRTLYQVAKTFIEVLAS